MGGLAAVGAGELGHVRVSMDRNRSSLGSVGGNTEPPAERATWTQITAPSTPDGLAWRGRRCR